MKELESLSIGSSCSSPTSLWLSRDCWERRSPRKTNEGEEEDEEEESTSDPESESESDPELDSESERMPIDLVGARGIKEGSIVSAESSRSECSESLESSPKAEKVSVIVLSSTESVTIWDWKVSELLGVEKIENVDGTWSPCGVSVDADVVVDDAGGEREGGGEEGWLLFSSLL